MTAPDRPPAPAPAGGGEVPAIAAPDTLARALPQGVRAVIDRLAEAGHETVAVGGGVRDALLGRPVHGLWDLATRATPDQVIALFPHAVPTGVEHGTVTLPEPQGAVEVTSYRSEHGYSDARRPDRVTFGATLEGDLARRDFTVNALAYDPRAGVLLDGTGGLEDLKARRLRAVGEPRARFREDALRSLRAARLAAVLGFTLEPATEAALAEVKDLVPRLSAERVRDELGKLLLAPRPSTGIAVLARAGLLELVLPELAATRGVTQNRHHRWDVYEHTLRTIDEAPARPRLRWAALAHDLGKPATRALREDGEATFHGHAAAGAAIADRMLERLRLPRAEREAIVLLVQEHLFDYRDEWTDAAVRRFVRRVGLETLPDLYDLRVADAIATGADPPRVEAIAALSARIETVLAARPPLSVRDLAIDGHDVMQVLEAPPGPVVGRVLDRLLEEVLDDPARNERGILLGRVRELAREGGPP
jgi:tRNA nucleotidyltransferase (CCA-adding enzyme)